MVWRVQDVVQYSPRISYKAVSATMMDGVSREAALQFTVVVEDADYLALESK